MSSRKRRSSSRLKQEDDSQVPEVDVTQEALEEQPRGENTNLALLRMVFLLMLLFQHLDSTAGLLTSACQRSADLL